MSSFVIPGKTSYLFGSTAYIVDEAREMAASNWASPYIRPNEALKWIVGRYVEADNANSNGQFWSLGDLRFSQPTISHSPMNMLHRAHDIVGTWVASEMLYPVGNDGGFPIPVEGAAQYVPENPYIEALGAFWKYYFPDQMDAVQRAHDAGLLCISMECVSESVTFEDGEDSQEFAYKGPFHESYGDWNNRSGAIRKLNKPHFLGGALILPPARPGWKNASVTEMSRYLEDNSEQVNAVYESIEGNGHNLSANQVEALTLAFMEHARLNGTTNNDSSITSSTQTNNQSAIQEVAESISTEESMVQDMADSTHSEGGDNVGKTFTEEDFQKAVAEAVAPFKAELEASKARADADAVEVQIAAVRSEYAEQFEELSKKLDAAVLEAQAAKDENAAIVAWLEDEGAKAAAEAERASRTEERLTAVKEVASFPQEHLDANIERWVAMSDEDFASTLADYAAVSTASAKGEETSGLSALQETAMSGARSEQTDSKTLRREVLSMRLRGIDPRTV